MPFKNKFTQNWQGRASIFILFSDAPYWYISIRKFFNTFHHGDPRVSIYLKGQVHCEIMIESYLECQYQSQELHNLLPCNWYNVLLWCIEKMQNCICRRINMGKCAKMMKMSCQNVVPKYVKVTTRNNTKHRLPYFKIIFQGLMALRIFNYGHRGWQNSFYFLPNHQPHCECTTSYIYHIRNNASSCRQQCLLAQFTYTHNKIIVRG